MNLIPFSDDYEKAIICGVLSDPLLLPKVTAILEPNDFFKEVHKEIYSLIVEEEPDKLDSLVIEDKLKSNQKALDYFQTLIQDSDKIIPNLSNVIYYAESVRGKSKLRAGIELGREIQAICYQPNIDPEDATQSLEDMFARFLQERVLENKDESTQESFKEFLASLTNRIEDTSGIKSGFNDLDLMLHRLEGLIVLAARPSMGKTAFAINIARNVAETRPVLFFSLEQSQEQVFERLLASESEVSLEEIKTGAFVNSPDTLIQVQDAEKRLIEVMKNIHVDDHANIPTSYITSVSRQKKYEWGDMGLIIIDYLHIMQLNDKQKVDALGDAVKEIRALGKELDCPVILLSQLSRENSQQQGKDKKHRRPELTDLRSSGEIEQSADVVIFLHRTSYYEPTSFADELDIAEVIVKKHRNGRQGIISLDWVPQYVKFKNPNIRRR